MLDCESCHLIDGIDNPNKYKSDGLYNHFLIVEKLRISYLPQHENYVNRITKRCFHKRNIFR
jgi:hypothetical protein